MINKETIELNKLYIIESTQTGKPYLTSERACMVFLDQSAAKTAASAIEGARVSRPRFMKLQDLQLLCYSGGADTLKINIEGNTESVPLTEQMFRRQPCNHKLAGSLALLKQTRSAEYLDVFPDCEFVVPVRVNKTPETEIIYAIAKHAADGIEALYVAFTDLDEFEVWAAQVPGWSPLKVDYPGLRRICGRHGVMLNPAGNRLILSAKLLDAVPPRKKPPKEVLS